MDATKKLELLSIMEKVLNTDEDQGQGDNWLARKEVARRLKCSTRHLIRKYEKTGRLKNYNPDGWAMYSEREVHAVLTGER